MAAEQLGSVAVSAPCEKSVSILVKRLWLSLSKRRKRQFSYLVILMSFVSLTEAVSIGAVVPFLAILTNPDNIYEYSALLYLFELLNTSSEKQFLLIVTIMFSCIAIVAGVMRMLLLWAYTKLSFMIGFDFGVQAYNNSLHQSYEYHTANDTSQVLNLISVKVNDVISRVLVPLIMLLGNVLIMLSILTLLFYLEPIVAGISTIGFATIYLVIAKVNKQKLSENSERISQESDKTVKLLQEGFGSIRDILLDRNQSVYSEMFSTSSRRLRLSQGRNSLITEGPRYLIESLAIVLITGLAYSLTLNTDNVNNVVPVLGAMALGGQRLLPLFQRAYMSWSSIKGYSDSLSDVIDFLEMPKHYGKTPLKDCVNFGQSIELKNVGFHYKENKKTVLNDINLKIQKGECIGFIGKTGSGKSTLIDILMGLLRPTSGTLLIDGVKITNENLSSWQSHIAHVPQDIYLVNDTIEKNIAFGVPAEDIDLNLVKRVSKYAQLEELIQSWHDHYQTIVGERGVQLSGGQRQRIGIARALYKESQVIIFDEASSALDNKTEGLIFNNIRQYYPNATILMIAHRTESLKQCDRIIELEESTIKQTLSYEEIVL